MSNVSRPLIGLLVASVAFFALWIVALKPSSSSSGGSLSSHPLGPYQSAINKAKGVQAIVNHGAAAAGGTPGTTATTAAVATSHPAATTASTVHTVVSKTTKTHTTAKARTTTTSHVTKSVTTTTTTTATPTGRLNTVDRALAEHKVLAVLFYNPYGADDQAVKQELGSIPTDRGKVVKLTVPLGELANYAELTNQVPVDFSPTLVIVNTAGRAMTIAGFTDTFEIQQRINQAL
jgi:hypothetical protein